MAPWAWATDFQSNWPKDLERSWVGREYWSNPLQDWRLRGGRLECIAAGGDRNVYLLTRDVAAATGTLSMSVRLGRLEEDRDASGPGFAGFRLGIRGIFKDYRDSAVRGYGMNAGLSANGRLFIARQGDSTARLSPPFLDLELRLAAEPAGGGYNVVLQAFDSMGKMLAETRRQVPADWLTGGVALVASSGPVEDTPPPMEKTLDPNFTAKRGTQRGGDISFWFRDWKVSGTKAVAHEERAWGPILFALHTLSRGVLKLTAQMAPVAASEPQEVLLQVRDPALWRTVAKARIDKLARTATFRVPSWNDTKDTPYRVVYGKFSYHGTIRKDPQEKPEIVTAAFTGNNDLGFPHADVVRNVKHFRPDLLAYTGDNIYERVGEYGIQRAPLEVATLDYLRKWYLFGWEYMDLLKEIPAVCLPDDHDVYHGNIWGAGGRHAEGFGNEGQDKGGYTMPAEWVNAVQRTQASHHPDPYDPTPVEQGITVYYGPLLVGGVSFAVIEDRKWKSPPKEFVPKARIVNGFAQNPAYNAAQDGDAPGAQLLGPRQEKFLEEWVRDWSGGAWMKAVISQTIFANLATLPAGSQSDAGTGKLRVARPGEYIEGDQPVADHDSDGWPQTPRTRALRTMRKGLAVHIAGDQHLGSTIQYGIDDWNDAGWALCVPSVANIFPRRWFPPQPGRNRKPGAPRYTGEFTEGFGNKVTVHAVSNPHEVAIEPAELHRRAPGYGIVKFRRATREIEIANWPRWIDATEAGSKPYPGWPITIRQTENGLPRGEWVLDPLQAPGMKDPVVEVIDQSGNELVYAFRIQGSSFAPPVRKEGLYTVKFLDPDRKVEKVFKDLKARRKG
ncbi:MAG: alkaline phosphatase D family protein [Acidobacteria bacterium]|nr:alkaline phosphatase D family protein [Acidobacteriota bacterium]